MIVRRLKTYTTEDGRAYEYYFVGRRVALPGDPCSPATEYVFDIIAEHGLKIAVSVFLTSSALESWQSQNRRQLSEAEQYAAAKRKLFRAFEEWGAPVLGAQRVAIGPRDLADLLLAAGVD